MTRVLNEILHITIIDPVNPGKTIFLAGFRFGVHWWLSTGGKDGTEKKIPDR